jgi:gamma-glutamyl:cysteine ligase YbdK (ATP-grasp superfamily)
MAMSNIKFPIFSVTGIEIEYMLVDKDSLDIAPIADQVLQALSPSNQIENEIEIGNIGVSNELALHVLELKSLQPVSDLIKLEQEFQPIQQRINQLLDEQFNALMLPTGAHPWFEPDENVALWPHGSREIYEAFHRIFNCSGHGWVNLQSIHINLPFSDDLEFKQLHNAIRLLMPLIPTLTASTPFIEGKFTGHYDSRLTYYGSNQQQFPMISGHVIPEVISSSREYHDTILLPIYQAIAPHDPNAILQHEWLNSRGAIARFDRSAIEIRVVDTQESLRQDMACVSAIVSALHYIVKKTDQYLTNPLDINLLHTLYQDSIKQGMFNTKLPAAYIRQFGFENISTPQQLWHALLQNSPETMPAIFHNAIEYIISNGNLAERMMKHYHNHPSLPNLYHQLAELTQSNGCFCA